MVMGIFKKIFDRFRASTSPIHSNYIVPGKANYFTPHLDSPKIGAYRIKKVTMGDGMVRYYPQVYKVNGAGFPVWEALKTSTERNLYISYPHGASTEEIAREGIRTHQEVTRNEKVISTEIIPVNDNGEVS
jgi:hypothetical protein